VVFVAWLEIQIYTTALEQLNMFIDSQLLHLTRRKQSKISDTNGSNNNDMLASSDDKAHVAGDPACDSQMQDS
jgi:hypothetical protein